jgi:hypothetical protein
MWLGGGIIGRDPPELPAVHSPTGIFLASRILQPRENPARLKNRFPLHFECWKYTHNFTVAMVYWTLIPPLPSKTDFLDSFGAAFASADADAVFEWHDEYFSIADLAAFASAAAADDGLDRGFDEVVVDRDFELHLAQEIYCIFMPAIDFGVAFLAAEALDIADREADDFDFVKSFFYGFQAGGLNDGLNQLHRGATPIWG